MFRSFFPNPKWFFLSLIAWFIINLFLWNSGGSHWGEFLGLPKGYANIELPIGVSRFWSLSFIWFYLWFFISTSIFAGFWHLKSDNRWQRWSVWGSAIRQHKFYKNNFGKPYSLPYKIDLTHSLVYHKQPSKHSS